jgi:hypothetical protein
MVIQFNSLFIYVLSSTANGQIKESAQIQTAIRQHMTKLQQRGQQNKQTK